MDLNNVGINYSTVNNAYPSFQMDYSTSDDIFKKHFKALLNYHLDHTNALNTFPSSTNYSEYYKNVLNYINANGIKTYGVLVFGTPKNILKLYSDGIASNIVIDKIKFNN